MSIYVSRSGRTWSRIVMDAGALDVRAVPRRGRVVQRERQPLGLSDERLDHRDQKLSVGVHH